MTIFQRTTSLGTGEPLVAKDVPTVDMYPGMSIQGVQLVIPFEAYKRLVEWASMGRTLGGVLAAMTSMGELVSVIPGSDADRVMDDADAALEELGAVRSALDECHQAARRHWLSLGTLCTATREE